MSGYGVCLVYGVRWALCVFWYDVRWSLGKIVCVDCCVCQVMMYVKVWCLLGYSVSWGMLCVETECGGDVV